MMPILPVISSNLEVNNFSRDWVQAQRLNDQGTGKAFSVNLTRPLSSITLGPNGYYTSVPVSQPRFGWDPVTLQPRGWFIGFTEAQNVLDYSEDFSQTYWEKNNITATLNTTFVTPSGNFSSYEFNEGTSTTKHALSSPPKLISSTAYWNYYSLSVFARAGTCDLLQLILDSDTGGFATNRWVTFNLTTGTVSNNPSNLEAYAIPAGNNWYKLMIAGSVANTGIPLGIQFAMCTTSTAGTKSPSYTGTGRNIYLWGAHFTRGPVIEYAPTYGLSAQGSGGLFYNLGRGDWTSLTTDSTIYQNSSAGTMFVEYIQYGLQGGYAGTIFTFGADSINQRIGFQSRDGLLEIGGHLAANNVVLYGPLASINGFRVTKAAFAWNIGSQGCAVNGTLLASGTVTQAIVGSDGLKPGATYLASYFISGIRPGWYRKIRYYPYRLPNQVLVGLTR